MVPMPNNGGIAKLMKEYLECQANLSREEVQRDF